MFTDVFAPAEFTLQQINTMGQGIVACQQGGHLLVQLLLQHGDLGHRLGPVQFVLRWNEKFDQPRLLFGLAQCRLEQDLDIAVVGGKTAIYAGAHQDLLAIAEHYPVLLLQR